MIVQAVRSMKMTPAELLAFLDNPATASGQVVSKSTLEQKEDTANEE